MKRLSECKEKTKTEREKGKKPTMKERKGKNQLLYLTLIYGIHYFYPLIRNLNLIYSNKIHLQIYTKKSYAHLH